MGVRVLKPAYMQYRHASLKEAERFLTDFGFGLCAREAGTLYFRGVAPDGVCYVAHEGEPAFIAGGFEVADREVLEEASGDDRRRFRRETAPRASRWPLCRVARSRWLPDRSDCRAQTP